MFGSTTMQIRLALSAMDRGLDLNLKLMVSRRSDEPMAHVVMRVLAFCIFYRSDLSQPLHFTSSPADRDRPDLWAHDLIGSPVEWIVCGKPNAEELRHVLKHQRQAAVRVLFGSQTEREEFFHDVHSLRRHILGLAGVDFRQVDAALVERLATSHLERQRWAVTIVEEHVYVDADGITADSEVASIRYSGETSG